MARYEIYEGNLERLEKKLVSISNKCKKYGCEFSFEIVGETFRDCKDDDGNVFKRRFVIADAEGQAIINGWKFAARIEHHDKGNVIWATEGVEIPERYYFCEPFCEHCGTHRNRKDTFVVQNVETGEFKQVGKACLADYTNGLSAEAVAQYISWFDELIKGEEPYDGVRHEKYYDKVEILRYLAETVKKFGFVKSDYDRPTKERGFDYWCVNHNARMFEDVRKEYQKEMEAVKFDSDSPDIVKSVNEALEWVKSQETDSNYMHNLKTVCDLEYVKYEHFGILASLIPVYGKFQIKEIEKAEKEKEIVEEAKVSEFLGEVGKRISVKVVDCKCIASYDNQFGTTYYYKFHDDLGNVIFWKSSKSVNENEIPGVLTGTIKAFNEYKGVKETEFTRCKISA